MLKLKKLYNTMELPSIPLEIGIKKVKSEQLELKEDIEDILYQIMILKKLYMPESQVLNKMMILKDKLNFLKKNIQNTPLFQILDQESISKEKDFKEFWTDYSKEISQKLWLPLKTDSHVLDMNCLSQYLQSLEQNLQVLQISNINHLNKNYLKTYSQSLQSSHPNIIKKETTQIVTQKIRIYPNAKQKLFFYKCFGTTRFIYNKVVEYVNNTYRNDIEKLLIKKQKGCINITNEKQCCQTIDDNSKFFCNKHKKNKIKYSIKVNLPHLRKATMSSDKDLSPEFMWLKEIPYDTRQLAIKDFCTAYKAAISNFKANNIDHFKFTYKNKKKPSQIFHIDKNAINSSLNLFRRRKIGKLRTRKRMKKWITKNIKNIECDCKIIRYKPNQYYLLLTKKQTFKIKKANFNIVSLDPGVRTFQTFYSPDGISGKLGDNIIKDRLENNYNKIDKFTSLTTKVKGKTKANIRKRIFLSRTKVKNIVSDMHWKVCKFLCENFQTIITTNFKIKQMTKKSTRNINNRSCRDMYSLSHYLFSERLKYSCKKYDRNLIVASEEYTSKTCGSCGTIDSKLGSNKFYNCKTCGLKIDRDINGARNILLKTLTECN